MILLLCLSISLLVAGVREDKRLLEQRTTREEETGSHPMSVIDFDMFP